MSKKLFGIEKAAEDLADRLRAEILSDSDASDIESPIERIFWITLRRYLGLFAHNHGLMPDMTPLSDEIVPRSVFQLGAGKQVWVLDWPIDFVFAVTSEHFDGENFIEGSVFRLAVECDGHDFHERTKEQAARDRARDRRLQEAGYTVMRFTGSEIYRDPVKCVLEVMGWAASKKWRSA